MLTERFLGVAAAIMFSAGAASAASILTFNSVDAPTDTSSWTLSCTACDMLAFLDDDGNAYNPYPVFDLDGSFGTTGSAWYPVTGEGGPSNRNPNLAGDAAEEDFLKAVIAAMGDTVVTGSFQKTGSTTDPNTAPGSPTSAGDYLLWKGSQYAGVAKILSISEGNVFSFSGSNGLSHIAHMSTTPVIPLPASLPLLLAGLGLGGVIFRKRRSIG